MSSQNTQYFWNNDNQKKQVLWEDTFKKYFYGTGNKKMIGLRRLPEGLGQHQAHLARSLSPRPVSLIMLLVLLGGVKHGHSTGQRVKT